jgi:hypothetical protein
MTVTYDFGVADAQNDAVETAIGTAPIMRVYNGTPPANVRTALSGNTVLAQGALPSDWMAGSSSGVKAKAGSWTLTGQSGAGAGTAGTFYRIFESTGTTAKEQGTFGAAVVLSTSALTAANGNVLNFASTTGVAVGQKASGAGVPPETTVLALTGTTVTLSRSCPAGVASAASITFGYDLVIDTNSIANAQTVTVTGYTKTNGNL